MVSHVEIGKKDRNDVPTPEIKVKVGDRVKLLSTQTGIVKFIGETEFAMDEVIGLELDTWTPNGHNGTIRGKSYFKTHVGRGYFIRRSDILKILNKEREPDVHEYKLQRLLKIGGKIRFKSNGDIKMMNLKTGIIKYIGYPTFVDGEVIGIELDEWNVNGHDGSVNGIQIFETSPGHGIFATRDEIEVYPF